MNNKLTVGLTAITTVVIILLLVSVGYVAVYQGDYYNDRLIVYFTDDVGDSQALVVDLSRYSTAPYYYVHNYTARLLTTTHAINASQTSHTTTSQVVTGELVQQVSNINHYNMLDESYQVTLALDGRHYSVDLKKLSSDFIVNNALERLTYVNLGTTTIQVDDKIYPASFALTKTLSSNINKSTLSEEAHGAGSNLFLVDAVGGLYLMDTTTVVSDDADYESHNWVLYKQGNVLSKIVNQPDFVLLEETNDHSLLTMSGLGNARFTLDQPSRLLGTQKSYYLLEGTIQSDNGVQPVGGLRMRYDY